MKSIQTETFLPGILTPEDIIHAHYVRIGKLGGSSITDKARDSKRRNLKKARAVRLAKLRAAKRQGQS
jgi:hypothetical protein